MKSRKALEIELLYSEEPEAFEKGYNDYWKFEEGVNKYEGMARLAYEAGWFNALNEDDGFNEGY